MKKQVAVLMPFHKQEMNKYEAVSFKNNCEKLKNYPIYLLLPQKLSAKPFRDVVPHIQVVYFDDCFFDTYHGSNQFWIQSIVYDYFKDYKYILKCELDAFVIKDELEYWIGCKYDYIGAPWIDKPAYINKVIKSITSSKHPVFELVKKILSRRTRNREYHIGNGGFSLRKVSSFKMISKMMPMIVPKLHGATIQEDTFWAFYVPSYVPTFQVPNLKTALQFSFETNPRKCFSINENRLPFGCHAWWKYDEEFWRSTLQVESSVKA